MGPIRRGQRRQAAKSGSYAVLAHDYESSTALIYPSINPYDGKVLMTFDERTGEQLEAALA